MKKSAILLVLFILISPISFALEPGKLYINDVFIPFEKAVEETKGTEQAKSTFYIYGNGQRIAKKQDNKLYYFYNDHLGSPRAISDDQGNIVWKADYLPFGETFNELNSDNKINYNSKEKDVDTKLHYYSARYYLDEIGRFITADSVEKNPNAYVYVSNNPLKYFDPKGKQKILPPGFQGPPSKNQVYFEDYYPQIFEDNNLFWFEDSHEDLQRRFEITNIMKAGLISELGLEMITPKLNNLVKDYLAGKEQDYGELRKNFERWEQEPYNLPKCTYMKMLDVAKEYGINVFGIKDYSRMRGIIQEKREKMEENKKMLILVGSGHVGPYRDDPQQFNLHYLIGGIRVVFSNEKVTRYIMSGKRGDDYIKIPSMESRFQPYKARHDIWVINPYK